MSKEFLEFCETIGLMPTDELWEAFSEAELVNKEITDE